jgi:type IV secretory pathway TrbL component
MLIPFAVGWASLWWATDDEDDWLPWYAKLILVVLAIAASFLGALYFLDRIGLIDRYFGFVGKFLDGMFRVAEVGAQAVLTVVTLGLYRPKGK